jgi:glutathione peroxidase
MKLFLISSLFFLSFMAAPKGLFDIKLKDINGKSLKLSKYKGKKILIVNVASKCGHTPQYDLLQELYEAHSDKLVIIGCPSNDFGGQEPGAENEILNFCKQNYGVTFPLTQKVGIKEKTHPLYAWLTQKAKNGVSDNEVKWNFTKFLINPDGSLYKCLPSATKPNDPQILEWINM